eukprot:6198384-Pleurochrysis_carterae.AAC.1
MTQLQHQLLPNPVATSTTDAAAPNDPAPLHDENVAVGMATSLPSDGAAAAAQRGAATADWHALFNALNNDSDSRTSTVLEESDSEDDALAARYRKTTYEHAGGSSAAADVGAGSGATVHVKEEDGWRSCSRHGRVGPDVRR